MSTSAIIRFAFYICSAVAVIFVVEAFYLAIMGPIRRNRGVNRRLTALGEQGSGEEALNLLRAERGIFSESIEVMGSLRRLLIQSGLRVTISRFLLAVFALTAAIFAGLHFLSSQPVWINLPIAVSVGLLLPLQIVRFLRRRRQAKFSSQLPDALDVVVRSLRSGHPVSVALGMVGREMPDPVGSEFGITIDEMTYGLDMPRALRNLADRVGVADLSLLVTSVSLQSGAGGNLSDVLGNLSKVLRDRFQLRRKVRSLSAEGRISAYGLTILPILVFLAIFLQNRRYYTDVLDEPIFLPIIVGIVLWSFVGDYIMFKMINFKY